MEVTDLDHHNEMDEEYGRICDRVMRLLERLADGEMATDAELEEVAADVAMMKTSLCSPCPYDFIAKLPSNLN
jgi:hypothetical protein